MLAPGCKAVAQAEAPFLIVFKSEIIFCFVLSAEVTTLFSTALVEVVESAASIDMALSQAGCLTQSAPS